MEIKKYYLILILISVLNAESQNYSITLYGIPMADVIIEERDTLYHNQDAVKIIYKTKTNKITSNLFKVDNIYETIIEKNTLKILSFQKSTFQPNVINHLYTTYENNVVQYNNSNIIIPENCFNIFSLLYYLSNNSFTSIKNSVILEREGLLYECKISKFKTNEKTEFELNFNLINDTSNAVIEHTDIFTWALFKKGSNNKIVINNSRIESCHFKAGLTNLKASIK